MKERRPGKVIMTMGGEMEKEKMEITKRKKRLCKWRS